MADTIVLDLEDGVPLVDKDLAREKTITSLQSCWWGDREIAIRINSWESG